LLHLGWLGLFVASGRALIPAWGASGLAWAFVLSYAPVALGGAIYAARALGARFTKLAPLVALTVITFAAVIALHLAVRGPARFGLGAVITLALLAAEWIWVFDARERAEVRKRSVLLRPGWP
jgi:hypothetical protein